MVELVERYVHQVGRYLPRTERAEIEAELRSQIQDQLDDRYGGSPTQADVASVLAELGDPHQMAASYNREQYLVGPDLYPTMMQVLRHGWLLIPAIVIFMNVFGALTSPQQSALPALFIDTLIGAAEATLIFSAVVVLIFAAIQHSGFEKEEKVFNPLELPDVDDPGAVDRLEAAVGVAVGIVVMLVFLYFAHVGGLTLRFNLSDPGEVIPVPVSWTILLIISAVAMILLHLLVLRRNRWSVGPWLVETVLEVFGAVCLYFVLYEPVVERIIASNPALASVPIIGSIPEIIVVSTAVITLVGRGSNLLKLWNYGNSSPRPFTTQTDR